jgi:hypothetical protein
VSLTLHESASRLGGFCWIERRLFETLGASGANLEDPEAKVMVDAHAAHAAWRGGQWWDRLPVLAVIDRDELVTEPSAAAAAVYDRLSQATGLVAVLAGFYRVALPRLAGAYRAFEGLTSPLSDGPARRTLAQVHSDVEADRAQGESFLHSLLVTAEAVDEASAATATLERVLAG